MKRFTKQSAGFTIIEEVIAVAIVGIVFTVFLQTLSGAIIGSQRAHERTLLVNLARSQIESIQKESFKQAPSTYTLISPVPQGYNISIDTSTARSFTYASPDAVVAPLTLQLITVTVTTDTANFQTSTYKARR